MAAVMVDPRLDDERRRQALYSGSLLVWPTTPAVTGLVALARQLLEEAFAPRDPVVAQHDLPVEEYASILSVVKPTFIHHPACLDLIPQIIAELGADPSLVYFDVPRLRSSTADNYLTTGIAYAFHEHRDTWYSAPQAQINWWLPIYEVDIDNGLAIYPDAFARALPNSSYTYNYYRWNLESRGSAATFVGQDTRVQPRLTAHVDLGSELRVVPPVGGVLAFSAQQLHASIPNTTDLTRFSVDFRTVHAGDLRDRLGAPRSDAECTGTTLRDFHRCVDLAPLPEELIAMYDDASSQQYADSLVYRVR